MNAFMLNNRWLLAALLVTTLSACGADTEPSPADEKDGNATDAVAVQDSATLEDVGLPEDASAQSQPSDTWQGADVPVVEVGLPLVEGGFKSGGLLARQYGLPKSISGHPLDFDVQDNDGVKQRGFWLLSTMDLSPESAVWSQPWQPDTFHGEWQRIDMVGALMIPDDVTSVTIAVAAVGSVQLEAGGELLLDDRDAMPLKMHKFTVAVVGKGWLAVKLRYVPMSFARHLQAWVDTGDGLKAWGPTQLAFPETPPSQDTKPKVEEVTTLYWLTRLRVTTGLPTTVEVQNAAGKSLMQSDKQTWMVDHVVDVPMTPNQQVKLKVRVRDLWGKEAWVEVEPIKSLALPTLTKGGLYGEYFADMTLTKVAMRRVDAGINFPSTVSSFSSLSPKDKFSVRWRGGVFMPKDGTYVLYFGTDDGQRVWLDGDQVVEDWVGHGTQYSVTKRQLKKGWHVLELHHFDSGGHAAAMLEWEGPGFSRQLIAPESLGYPTLQSVDKAPEVTSKAVTRVDADTVSVKVGWSVLATAKLSFAPLPGELTKTTINLPADGFVQVLPDWGKGAGTIEMTPTSLTGKTGKVIKLLVPGMP